MNKLYLLLFISLVFRTCKSESVLHDEFPTSCADPSITTDGIYFIYPDGLVPIEVYCEVESGGWTRILNKIDRSPHAFNKSYVEYQLGFGQTVSNYWIGLDNLRRILGREPMSLRIELSSEEKWVEYDSFYVGHESQDYRLSINYKTVGNLGDTFQLLNNAPFTNNNSNTSCGHMFNSKWWFNAFSQNKCYAACLTCEKDFAHNEGHWYLADEDTWIIANDIKMLTRPKYVPKPRNCFDIYKAGRIKNGIYHIYLNDDPMPTEVYCEMSLGGWTRILNRDDSNRSSQKPFLRSYGQYKVGFGDLRTNYWFGLKNMESLMSREPMQLRIEFSESKGKHFIVYDQVYLKPESDSFALVVGNKVFGTVSDVFQFHSDVKFSTYDHDNDHAYGNCGVTHDAGWWFTGCYEICLTCTNRVTGHVKINNIYQYFSNAKMMLRPQNA